MRFRPLALLTLLAATAATASAQQPGAPSPGGRGQGQGQGRMMMNPSAFEGPPAAAAFATIVGLSDAQKPKYAALRSAYMTATQAQRDSLKTLREGMRAGMQAGDREAARPQMQAMRALGTAVNERYEEFEAELQFLLTAPQQEKFTAWKESERTRMLEERRRRMQGRAGGGR